MMGFQLPTNFPQLVSLPTGFLVGINSMTVAEVLYIVTLTSPQYLFAPLGRPRLTEVFKGGGVSFFFFHFFHLPQPPKKKVGVVVTSIPTKTTPTQLCCWEGKSCWGQEDVCVCVCV